MIFPQAASDTHPLPPSPVPAPPPWDLQKDTTTEALQEWDLFENNPPPKNSQALLGISGVPATIGWEFLIRARQSSEHSCLFLMFEAPDSMVVLEGLHVASQHPSPTCRPEQGAETGPLRRSCGRALARSEECFATPRSGGWRGKVARKPHCWRRAAMPGPRSCTRCRAVPGRRFFLEGPT